MATDCCSGGRKNPPQRDPMNTERLTGIAATVFRGMPLLVFGVAAAAALATTVHWHQTNTRRAGRAPFHVTATPGKASVTAGSTAHYRIAIRRGRFHGQIKLKLVTAAQKGISNYASAHERNIRLAVHGQGAVLTVRTNAPDRPGRYAVRL